MSASASERACEGCEVCELAEELANERAHSQEIAAALSEAESALREARESNSRYLDALMQIESGADLYDLGDAREAARRALTDDASRQPDGVPPENVVERLADEADDASRREG